jgi:hypothetical protein
MSLPVRVIIFMLGLMLSAIIFELVRRKKFREELSLMWFTVGIAIMASSVADLIIDPVSRLLKIGYPPALVFVWVIFFLILALLYFSVLISDLKGKIKELSQKIALLEFKLTENHTKDDR